MVKGVSRRIVVVRSPEQNIFEEAIFILKDDALKKGISAEDVVAQACGIASRYIRENRESRAGHAWIPAVCIIGGVLLGTLAWVLLMGI